jgi:adenylate cyclase
MSEGTQRRLAAIVSADVVGYSRLMGVDETGTLAAMRAHRSELWNPVIEQYGGRVVGTAGDSLLIEYASAVAAVESSVAVQRGMIDRNADLPEERRMLLRIGVNIGEVVIEGDDIFGDGVNVAARLQAIADTGGIVISGNIHEQVNGKLDVTFSDDGEREFKNIDRPVHVWRWLPDAKAKSDDAATSDQPLALPDKPSIAVLPFDNMSGDPEQEYFADGITEDVITALSKFHSFLVIARNSTFTYKGNAVDVSEIGKELGVRYVVEGSVRKAGNRVRITSQLIEAASGNHVWAERYDRNLEDIFDLQDEITETIVGAVEQEIGSVERTRAVQKHPDSLEAWELLQRGLHHLWQMNADGLRTSAVFFRQSIAKDPSFAQAHSYLAFSLMHQVILGFTDDVDQFWSSAETHATEALKFDDRDSLAHEMQARILSFQHNHDEAVTEARRAVQFNPNSSSANFTLGIMCYWANRCAEGLEPVDRAIRLSPKDPRYFHHSLLKGAILCEIGRAEEGLILLRRSASLPHGDYRPAMYLACHAAEAGLIDEAQKAAAKLLELKPDFTLGLFETKLSAHMHRDLVKRNLKSLSRLDLPK